MNYVGIRLDDDLWEIISDLYTKNPTNTVISALYNFQVKRDKIDYLSLVKKDEDVLMSFLPTPRVNDVAPAEHYASKLRQECRIGRALKKILNIEFKESDLKDCVEAIYTEGMQNDYELFLVDGEDIRQYYSEKSYKQAANSELGKSCMRHEHCQLWFGIYETNPNLKMVVCKKRGLLVARALVWESVKMPTENTEVFDNATLRPQMDNPDTLTVLDRIYSAHPAAKAQIYEWGKANCDLMHTTPKDPYRFYVPKLDKTFRQVVLSQPLEKYKFRNYPYIDTFKFFSVTEKMISNNQVGLNNGNKIIHFTNTEGKFDRVTSDAPSYSRVQEQLDMEEMSKSTITLSTATVNFPL